MNALIVDQVTVPSPLPARRKVVLELSEMEALTLLVYANGHQSYDVLSEIAQALTEAGVK